jgi:hypothetical protein
MDDIYGRGGGKFSFLSGLHQKWAAGKDFGCSELWIGGSGRPVCRVGFSGGLRSASETPEAGGPGTDGGPRRPVPFSCSTDPLPGQGPDFRKADTRTRTRNEFERFAQTLGWTKALLVRTLAFMKRNVSLCWLRLRSSATVLG